MDCVDLLFKRIGIIIISSDFCGKKCILVCSEIPFWENPYHIEPNQWTRFIDQLAGFSIIRDFTERCFRCDYNKVGFGLEKCVLGGQKDTK